MATPEHRRGTAPNTEAERLYRAALAAADAVSMENDIGMQFEVAQALIDRRSWPELSTGVKTFFREIASAMRAK